MGKPHPEKPKPAFNWMPPSSSRDCACTADVTKNILRIAAMIFSFRLKNLMYYESNIGFSKVNNKRFTTL